MLAYATTKERAERLRKEFSHRGPVYVASDLDELQRLDNDHYAFLFVAADDDAQLADLIMGRESLDRVTIHLHPDPTRRSLPAPGGLRWSSMSITPPVASTFCRPSTSLRTRRRSRSLDAH
ncbi:MAG: hypothetical protein OHK0015_03600 [Chloroflexi bacterium OHK40]